jgi:PIN domain nuclease of toxin-antitoxin system
MANGFLLDTHVFVKFVNGVENVFSRERIYTIESAAAQERLFLSQMSFLEIAQLQSVGRLHLAQPTARWLSQAMHRLNARVVLLEDQICGKGYELSRSFPKDPADRVLVATAIVKNLTLVTEDQAILNHSIQGLCNAIPPK